VTQRWIRSTFKARQQVGRG